MEEKIDESDNNEIIEVRNENNRGLWNKIKKYKKEHKKKYYIIIFSILLTIIVSISVIIPVSILVKRKNLYKNLVYEMEYFSNNSINKIDNIIKKLPENYKDVDTISTQFKSIKKYVKVLSENYSVDIWNFSEGSSDKIRDAYLQLLTLSPQYLDWNLEGYLDSIRIEILIFDAKWTSVADNKYTFEWSYNKDKSDRRLSSTIPNEKKNDKEYYFTTDKSTDYIIFGYENKVDENDKFNAFKVSNFRYKNSTYYVDVYCFKEDRRYVFAINN